MWVGMAPSVYHAWIGPLDTIMSDSLLAIRPRAEDVEGVPILRPLPSAQRRSIGPFVFFDHMLESSFAPEHGMDIRQHPHIGLSTLTYLFEGQVQHKDSLGSDQRVLPGDVSWMTAGRGVATSSEPPPTCCTAARACTACRSGWLCRASSRVASPATATTPAPACRKATTWACASA